MESACQPEAIADRGRARIGRAIADRDWVASLRVIVDWNGDVNEIRAKA